jgi:hypothetical protein
VCDAGLIGGERRGAIQIGAGGECDRCDPHRCTVAERPRPAEQRPGRLDVRHARACEREHLRRPRAVAAPGLGGVGLGEGITEAFGVGVDARAALEGSAHGVPEREPEQRAAESLPHVRSHPPRPSQALLDLSH